MIAKTQTKIVLKDNLIIGVGIFLIGYCLLQLSSIIYAIGMEIEPDWISLLKILNLFILLPSAMLLIVGVIKVNVTAILITEVMLIVTAIGFTLYSILMLMVFISEKDYGSNFYVFLGQRIFFYVLIAISAILVNIYRRDLAILTDTKAWIDEDEVTAEVADKIVKKVADKEVVIEKTDQVPEGSKDERIGAKIIGKPNYRFHEREVDSLTVVDKKPPISTPIEEQTVPGADGGSSPVAGTDGGSSPVAGTDGSISRGTDGGSSLVAGADGSSSLVAGADGGSSIDPTALPPLSIKDHSGERHQTIVVPSTYSHTRSATYIPGFSKPPTMASSHPGVALPGTHPGISENARGLMPLVITGAGCLPRALTYTYIKPFGAEIPPWGLQAVHINADTQK